ncbi:MAG TPA: PAS domain S-box protein, partial [Candidatus Limnocylindria bacterium]|nr:PAS domain S-box protein [Candidatus Limnocylindria bacterium]
MIQARDYAETLIHTTREALLVVDPELKVILANRAFYETFHTSPEQTLDRTIYEVGHGQWNMPKLRELLEQLLPATSMVQDFEVMHDFPNIGPKIMSINARKIYNKGRKDVQLILLAISDLTETQARARLAAVVESSDDAIIGMNLDGIVTSWNAGAERIFGYSAAEMIGQSVGRLIPLGQEKDEEQILQRLRHGERMEQFETVRVTRDKRLIHVSLTVSPIKDSKGNVIGASKIARDITERKRIEQQRQ